MGARVPSRMTRRKGIREGVRGGEGAEPRQDTGRKRGRDERAERQEAGPNCARRMMLLRLSRAPTGQKGGKGEANGGRGQTWRRCGAHGQLLLRRRLSRFSRPFALLFPLTRLGLLLSRSFSLLFPLKRSGLLLSFPFPLPIPLPFPLSLSRLFSLPLLLQSLPLLLLLLLALEVGMSRSRGWHDSWRIGDGRGREAGCVVVMVHEMYFSPFLLAPRASLQVLPVSACTAHMCVPPTAPPPRVFICLSSILMHICVRA